MDKIQQKMGYDRSITMFSPDGRLLQVEYAKKTVRQGSTALGLVCRDGVLLLADKRIVGKLIIPEAVEKVFPIDDHIVATAAGIISDARVLIERAQVRAQQHRVTYDTKLDVLTVVKDVCDLCQLTTQSAGYRPFGVSLLIGGVDNDGTPKLFLTDPTGIFFRYRAAVIGESSDELEKILQKKYKQTMTADEALPMAVELMLSVLPELSLERLDAVIISSADRKYRMVSKEKLRPLLSK